MNFHQLEQAIIRFVNFEYYIQTEFPEYNRTYNPNIDFHYFYLWTQEFPDLDIEHRFYEFHDWLKENPQWHLSCYRGLFRHWLEENYSGARSC